MKDWVEAGCFDVDGWGEIEVEGKAAGKTDEPRDARPVSQTRQGNLPIPISSTGVNGEV